MVIHRRSRFSYAAGAMKTIWDALDAFPQERPRCGEMDSGVEKCVWMVCECGAEMAQPRTEQSKDS